MSVLLDKIRKARESAVTAGGFRFTVRRPTDVEVMGLRGNVTVAALIPFVVGWEGVKELDLIAGGDPHPLAFDAAVCAEWLSDRPDLLRPLAEEIMAGYQRHVEAMEAAAKN